MLKNNNNKNKTNIKQRRHRQLIDEKAQLPGVQTRNVSFTVKAYSFSTVPIKSIIHPFF